MCLEPTQPYIDEVTQAYHISQVASDIVGRERINIWMEKESKKYLLASLNKAIPNCPLDITFSRGDKITFYTSGGNYNVYLTGFLIPDDISNSIRYRMISFHHKNTENRF